MMKPFGFKEWKLVCDLLEAGEQTLVLRKGGISEGKRGFQWLHEEFFLFPTWFHAQEDQLRLPEGWRPAGKGHGETESGEVEIRLWAELVERAELGSLDQVRELEARHAWKDEVVRERFGWGEQPGLSVAVLRVWKLGRPWRLRQREAFGGCRSWLGLPEDEGLEAGWREGLTRTCAEEEVQEAAKALRGLAQPAP